MDEAVTYLECFDKASTELQKSLKPTLHMCYPYYFNLLAESASSSADSNLIKTFKQNCSDMLISQWHPELKIQHLVATFLYPRCNNMSVFPLEEKQEVYSYIAKMFDSLIVHNRQYNV